jgi:DNA-binding CsgD family transcriptional regulator
MEPLAPRSEELAAGVESSAPSTAFRKPPAAAWADTHWLSRMLDEVDYGMLLLDDHAQVLHANHTARAECAGNHPLQVHGDELLTRRSEHAPLLRDALDGARRGRRKLLALGEAGHPLNIAVVPLEANGRRATLLVMGRRQVCEPLSVHGFARCHGLTPAETRLLEGLCAGMEPRALALQHGVSLTTVRTQICSLRTKTGAESIRELVRQVSILPPIVGSLRSL